MAESNLLPRGHQNDSKVRVNGTEIDASLGVLYPRLLVPIHLELIPLQENGRPDESYAITGCLARLSIANSVVADARPISSVIRTYPGSGRTGTTYSLEFPLDPLRVKAIEALRSDDLAIRLELTFTYLYFDRISIPEPSRSEIMTDVEVRPVTIGPIEIPQSHWVRKVLPKLGAGDYFFVEVPRGKQSIREAWSYLEKADQALREWNTKAVFANCRETGSLLDRTLKTTLGATSFAYAEKWGRALANFQSYASTDLHLEDIKRGTKYTPDEVQVGRSDAAHAVLATRALIKYAEELLPD